MNSAMVEQMVKAGASFLDETDPGWEAKVDLSTLDMNSSSECIVGQTQGDYADFANSYAMDHDLDPNEEHAFFYSRGFIAGYSPSGEYVTNAELGGAWVDLIEARMM